MNLDSFLRWREALQTRLQIELAFIDMCGGDHMAALLLTLILDLHKGRHLGVVRDMRVWVAVPWQDLWTRSRIRPKGGRRALDKLEQLGFIRRKTFQIAGARRALHVSLDEPTLMRAWGGVLAGEAPVFPQNDAD